MYTALPPEALASILTGGALAAGSADLVQGQDNLIVFINKQPKNAVDLLQRQTYSTNVGSGTTRQHLSCCLNHLIWLFGLAHGETLCKENEIRNRPPITATGRMSLGPYSLPNITFSGSSGLPLGEN